MRANWKWMVPASVVIGIVMWTSVPVWGQTAAPDTKGVTITGSYGFGLPPDVSEHGWQIDRIIGILHWFMFLLFGGWAVFFVHTLWRYRHREGHTAQYEHLKAKPAKLVEVGVIIFEAVLLLGFSIPVWGSVKNDIPKPSEKPVRIRVVAEQFAWNFHYPGPDGEFGKVSPASIDVALNPLGLIAKDNKRTAKELEGDKGGDDVAKGELHIPVNEPVILEISSKDVIHSFFVPVLRVKQDAIPGMRIPIWFRTKKEGAEGTYEIACAQLCGNNHYNMKALLHIESRAKYEEWLIKASKVDEFLEE